MSKPYKTMLIKYNQFSRPMTKLTAMKGIILHWTANFGATARNHYNYFNNLNGRYASAQVFVDKNEALLIIPENEVAYHANDGGYSKVSKFRASTKSYINGNANLTTLGIEMCVEKDGSIHPNTVARAKAVTEYWMNKYKLSSRDVYRHFDVTGKTCPRPWVNNSKLFTNFKNGLISGGRYNGTGGYKKNFNPKNGEIGVITVAVPLLNVRQKASFNSKVVKTIKKGKTYRVYDQKNGLYKLGNGQWTSAHNYYTNFTKAGKPKATVAKPKPAVASTYKVKKGDTLYRIARKFGEKVEDIKSINNLKSNVINIGQTLRLSGKSASKTKRIIIRAASLWYYKSANWNDRKGTVKKGEIFTVVDTVKVNGYNMYKLKSGNYITASDQYVRIL